MPPTMLPMNPPTAVPIPGQMAVPIAAPAQAPPVPPAKPAPLLAVRIAYSLPEILWVHNLTVSGTADTTKDMAAVTTFVEPARERTCLAAAPLTAFPPMAEAVF